MQQCSLHTRITTLEPMRVGVQVACCQHCERSAVKAACQGSHLEAAVSPGPAFRALAHAQGAHAVMQQATLPAPRNSLTTAGECRELPHPRPNRFKSQTRKHAMSHARGHTLRLQSAPAQPSEHSHMPRAHTPCPLQRPRSSQALMGCRRSLMQARQHSAGATGKIWPAPKRLRGRVCVTGELWWRPWVTCELTSGFRCSEPVGLAVRTAA